MSTRSKYQITFQKSINFLGSTSYYAISNSNSYGQVAFHLENSSSDDTLSPITDINDIVSSYQTNLPYDEFLGEIAGSQLFVYPNNNTIQLGNSTVPIPDFLQLLQEWDEFIGD